MVIVRVESNLPIKNGEYSYLKMKIRGFRALLSRNFQNNNLNFPLFLKIVLLLFCSCYLKNNYFLGKNAF